jgi:hypothetical protein
MPTEKWTGPVGRLWSFEAIKGDGGPGRSTAYMLIDQERLECIKVAKLTRISGRSYDAYKESLARQLDAPPHAA